MKIRFFILVGLSFLVINFSTVMAEENPSQMEFEPNTKFNIPDVEISPDTYVLDFKNQDVNGDNVNDSVILIGVKEAGVNSAYEKNINIVVKDGRSYTYKKVMPGPIDSGYGAKLYLGDFNRDKVSDIFTTIGTGGSGGTSMYSIISFKDNNILHLFNQIEFSQGLKFDILFKDKFKIEVANKETGKKFRLDIGDRKNEYIEMKVYDKRGKLINPITGSANAISLLQPVNRGNDGNLELYSVQRLTGVANADTVGYAAAIWRFENGKFILKDLKISTNL